MSTTAREREDTFDVDAGFVLPGLTELVPEGGRIASATVRLRSTYHDTADHRLLAQRVTLRRREGDTDTGWQLKVPDGVARTEIRLGPDVAAGATGVPDELADLTRGLARGAALQVVAVFDVVRTAHRVLDAGDALVAELADDDVRVSVPTAEGVTARAWRELEVELGPSGSEQLLQRAAALLTDAGAAPARSPSKLARALGVDLTAPEVDPSSSARDVVAAYVGAQVTAVLAGDLGMRRGLDPIHPTRVATRRLRSTLRTFGELVDPVEAADLDGELRWYAAVLGEVRDRQVQRGRLAEAIGSLPPELVVGPVADDVETLLAAEQEEHRAALLEVLDGPRYRTLLDTLTRWAEEAPWRPTAEGSAGTLVGKAAHRAAKRTARRLAAAVALPDPAERDEALHRARKAAKRARYAAELATPVLGRHAAGVAVDRYKGAQDQLGEHQDGVVGAALLLRLAAAARAAGHPDFTYGVLYAREVAAAERGAERAATLDL